MTTTNGIAGLVSVLVPTYNGAATVASALDSVLQGSYENVELIVVDDGSTDDTCEVVREYAARDGRVRLIRRSQPSGGPALPRTVGLKQSVGEFVALLDHDDYWLPNKLNAQIPRFLESDIALVYSDVFVDESERGTGSLTSYLDRFALEPAQGDVRESLLRTNFVPTVSATFRREWGDRLGTFGRGGRIDLCDDYDFWLRVAFSGGRFAFVDEPLAVYRLHQSNLGRRSYGSIEAQAELVFRSLVKEFPDDANLITPRLREIRITDADISLRLLFAPNRSARERGSDLATVLAGPPSASAIADMVLRARAKLGRVARRAGRV